jgi:hypothetical protein
MDGAGVVAAYRDLYQVERSFRMARSNLAARPMFHRVHESIEAHLTIVFAARAVSPRCGPEPALSITMILQRLRPFSDDRAERAGVTGPPHIPEDVQRSSTTLSWVVTNLNQRGQVRVRSQRSLRRHPRTAFDVQRSAGFRM